MPEYRFLDLADGEVVLLEFSMGDAPNIGDEIVLGGDDGTPERRYRRLINSPPQLAVRPDRRHVSHSLPLNWKFAPRHDERGRPVFHNRQEIVEAQAKADHGGESVTYDS